jgi:antitoxin component YwqK of YwqJK toxin-antitoxin module
MTEKEFFRSDKNHGSEKYFYNSGGVISNADFENSDMWLSGELKYTVDQHGLPLKAYYKDNKECTADILFEYDNKDLLKKIVWNFSDGSRQVYSYFY